MIPAFVVSPMVTIAATFVAIALAFSAAYLKGRQDGREAMLAQQLASAGKFVKRQDKVTERVVVQFRDRVQVVREKGEEVIREVEKLVPVDSCPLGGGFRVLHDAAADGALPSTPDGAHGPAAPVEQAAAAEVVAGNYVACHLNAEQLKALQAWVQKQHKLTKGE